MLALPVGSLSISCFPAPCQGVALWMVLTAMDAIAEPHRGSVSAPDGSVRVEDPGSGRVNTVGLDAAGGVESGPSLGGP